MTVTRYTATTSRGGGTVDAAASKAADPTTDTPITATTLGHVLSWFALNRVIIRCALRGGAA